MQKIIPTVLVGILAMGTAAIAAEGAGPAAGDAHHGVRMQGSPNAAGFKGKTETGKTETGTGEATGTTATGSPGSEMPRQGGRMQGPPNAAGFQKGDDKAPASR